MDVDPGYPGTSAFTFHPYQTQIAYMTDDLVHTRAHTLWESAIVERTRVRITIQACLMTNRVKLVGRDSGFDM